MTSRLIAASVSLLIGLFLTWGTGVFPTPFETIQIDVVTYGAPLTYSTRVIPTLFITYNWLNLVLDLAFWVITTYLILAVVLRTSPKNKTD
jgi:hypothetical protein